MSLNRERGEVFDFEEIEAADFGAVEAGSAFSEIKSVQKFDVKGFYLVPDGESVTVDVLYGPNDTAQEPEMFVVNGAKGRTVPAGEMIRFLVEDPLARLQVKANEGSGTPTRVRIWWIGT